MHRTHPDGTVISSHCDFCDTRFEDAAMIEGHQGSLLCGKCLSAAWMELGVLKGGQANTGAKCTMCLENRNESQWRSPMNEQASVCIRCVRMAATAFERDPDTGWKRPGPPVPASQADDE